MLLLFRVVAAATAFLVFFFFLLAKWVTRLLSFTAGVEDSNRQEHISLEDTSNQTPFSFLLFVTIVRNQFSHSYQFFFFIYVGY